MEVTPDQLLMPEGNCRSYQARITSTSHTPNSAQSFTPNNLQSDSRDPRPAPFYVS